MESSNYQNEINIQETKQTSEEENPNNNKKLSGNKQSFITVFSGTFLTIFLAEMGDKTQLSTLLLAAESGKPWLVFLGAALALISTTLVGVVIGYWLTTKVKPEILDLFLALLLLFVAGLLIGDVVTI